MAEAASEQGVTHGHHLLPAGDDGGSIIVP
jgi:hypothetical protein